MFKNQTVRQMGYCVEDVRTAVQRHHDLFGSGPFFIAENVVQNVTFRGEEVEFHSTTAFGQWGDLQIEIMQSLPSGPPNILDELYPRGSGRFGLHHITFIVDDFDASVADMEKAGFEVALSSYIDSMDAPAVMIDAVERYGHYIELYPGVRPMVEFYDMVEDAAKDFDGKDLFHEIKI